MVTDYVLLESLQKPSKACLLPHPLAFNIYLLPLSCEDLNTLKDRVYSLHISTKLKCLRGQDPCRRLDLRIVNM